MREEENTLLLNNTLPRYI